MVMQDLTLFVIALVSLLCPVLGAPDHAGHAVVSGGPGPGIRAEAVRRVHPD
jgi:hypothetical protein